jgi:hypothetical protein
LGAASAAPDTPPTTLPTGLSPVAPDPSVGGEWWYCACCHLRSKAMSCCCLVDCMPTC